MSVSIITWRVALVSGGHNEQTIDGKRHVDWVYLARIPADAGGIAEQVFRMFGAGLYRLELVGDKNGTRVRRTIELRAWSHIPIGVMCTIESDKIEE